MNKDGSVVNTNGDIDSEFVKKHIEQCDRTQFKTKKSSPPTEKLLNGDISTNDEIVKNELDLDQAVVNTAIKNSDNNFNTEKNGCEIPLQMITLGSNNNVFMTSQRIQEQPLFAPRQLPQYLQDTLAESLSKISIVDNNTERIISFIDYESEEHLPDLTALITKDLSEPYSIYTYRYFLHNWPQLSFLAYCEKECVGAIVCKLDQHRKNIWRGYIAMLVVRKDFRRYKIGSKLVQKAIRRMIEQGCDEVVLETEVTNKAALNLYENLGFVRDKRLLRYYLNGVDAWRLKLWLV